MPGTVERKELSFTPQAMEEILELSFKPLETVREITNADKFVLTWVNDGYQLYIHSPDGDWTWDGLSLGEIAQKVVGDTQAGST